MRTHQITYQWTNGLEVIAKTISQSSETSLETDVACNGSDTNGGSTVIAQALDQSQIKSLYLVSDKDISLSFATSGEAIVIALTANVPVAWIVGCGLTNPITADTTALTVTKLDVGNAALTMRFLIDTTA